MMTQLRSLLPNGEARSFGATREGTPAVAPEALKGVQTLGLLKNATKLASLACMGLAG